MKMHQQRIIVLGAGASGLACARELTQRGHEVLVVEARSRVGGRLKGEYLELGTSHPNQTPNGGEKSDTNSHPVDLGGALIHGITQNPVHAITTQMGVPLHIISDYCLLLDENGWPFDPKVDEKISNLFNECLDITFQRAEQDKESNLSFGELFDEVCREKGVNPDNPLLKWHQANLELPSGADFHELGYRWNDDEPYGFTGDHAAVEPSWRFVMERLADGLNIMYQSPVTQINIVLPDGTCPASIKTQRKREDLPNEPKEEGDESKYAKGKPPPPTRRSKPTSALASPTRFSRRLRGDDVNVRRSARSNKGIIKNLQIKDAGSLCYDDPSKKSERGKRKRKAGGNLGRAKGEPPSSTVQITLQNGTVLAANALVCTLPLGILKIPEGKPGHVRFVPPLPKQKHSAIDQLGCGLLNKCAMTFSSVFWQDSDFLGLAERTHSYLVLNAMKYTQKPILIFMYGGSFAKELESWTDTEIVEDCLAVLKKICGKDVPSPVDYCVTRWGKEQFSRMAFTYIPPGVNGSKELSIMSEAIEDPALPNKPLVMFAGEHTTPYHPSTMHGAFLSGIREAYRYDLFVEPALNGHLEFEGEEKLYEHTFPTRRVYKTAKTSKYGTLAVAQSAAPVSPSKIRSRRRRFAGMTLRKQPKKIFETPPSSPKKNTMKTPDGSAKSRRSQRSLSAKKKNGMLESPNNLTVNEIAFEKKRLINELEDRTLLRSLESYGRDCALLRSQIVPVYGSSRKRSADQIRSRWQNLMTRPIRPEVWKEWVAKNIALTPKDNGLQMVSSKSSSKEFGNVRRSKREAKARTLVDI